MSNDFEAPSAPVEREIKVKGKTATYLFTEPNALVLETLFSVNGDDGKPDPEKLQGIRFRVIAAIAKRADGSAISVAQAGQMSTAVANALYKAALEVVGADVDIEETGNV